MPVLTIGSRESALAMAQARIVMEAIVRHNPSVTPRLVTIKTLGDKLLDRPLEEIGGKGVFIRELDRLLLERKVDLCVHSFKDMPADGDDALPVVAVSAREDARDVLLLRRGLERLEPGMVIGCSSMRRRVQLPLIFPGCMVKPVRGNVLTRLDKLDGGGFDALVLAAAGVRRLGLEERVGRYFTVEEMLPAACQGILAVQGRGDVDTDIFSGFHSREAWDAAVAERAFVRALGGDCTAPIGAYAEIEGDTLLLRGMLADARGLPVRAEISGRRGDAALLGKRLAEQMLSGKGD